MSTGLTSTRPSRKNIFGRNFLENYRPNDDHGNYVFYIGSQILRTNNIDHFVSIHSNLSVPDSC